MKLTIDIIQKHLIEDMSVKQYGHSTMKLTLSRPLLYDGTSNFQSGHVYIAPQEHLPKQPLLEAGTAIIVIGTHLPQAYYSDHCQILLLHTTESIQMVFNRIQKIFDTYDAWDAALQQIAMERGKIASLLKASRNVFSHPLFMLDKSLDVTAHSLSTNEKQVLDQHASFTTDDSFIQSTLLEAANKNKGIYMYNKARYKVMCLHVFKKDAFVGGIYMKGDSFHPSDQALLLHLKTYVDFLLGQYHEILSVDTNTIKEIFYNVLNGTIFNNMSLLKELKMKGADEDRYVCIKFKLEDNSKVIPATLVCEQIEDILPNTVAVVYENVIVAFMNVGLSDPEPKSKGSIFIHFLQAMGYKVGLSNAFTDILQAKSYFVQACAAIDIGYDKNADLEVYYFKDYVIEYMLSLITSEIPTELLCHQGLLRLVEYDQRHTTTYYEELRMYINCNMNAVQAAKKLYMHRNTLLIHLEHILKLSKIDLENPEERMYVQLSYKLLEREQTN